MAEIDKPRLGEIDPVIALTRCRPQLVELPGRHPGQPRDHRHCHDERSFHRSLLW